MSDTPLQIASSTIQFLGVRSVVDDIFKVFRFVQSSREYSSDLSWLAGSARWELESLDQCWADMLVSGCMAVIPRQRRRLCQRSNPPSWQVRRRVGG